MVHALLVVCLFVSLFVYSSPQINGQQYTLCFTSNCNSSFLYSRKSPSPMKSYHQLLKETYGMTGTTILDKTVATNPLWSRVLSSLSSKFFRWIWKAFVATLFGGGGGGGGGEGGRGATDTLFHNKGDLFRKFGGKVPFLSMCQQVLSKIVGHPLEWLKSLIYNMNTLCDIQYSTIYPNSSMQHNNRNNGIATPFAIIVFSCEQPRKNFWVQVLTSNLVPRSQNDQSRSLCALQ